KIVRNGRRRGAVVRPASPREPADGASRLARRTNSARSLRAQDGNFRSKRGAAARYGASVVGAGQGSLQLGAYRGQKADPVVPSMQASGGRIFCEPGNLPEPVPKPHESHGRRVRKGRERPPMASETQKHGYNPREIEPKWQAYWDRNKTFKTPDDD